MPTTSGNLRYPATTDAVDVPGDMKKLADDVDTYKAPSANPTFTGQVIVPAGSAGAPAIAPTGDTNTGLFSDTADTLAISTGGTERVRVSSTGLVYLGNGATASTPNSAALYATGGSGTDKTGAAFGIYGGISTGAGAGGAISLYTSPAGASSSTANTATERVKVDSNGLITGTGTSLGAWTAYTPTLSGTGWAIGNGTATGAYAQLGKLVVFRAAITFGSTSTFGAGAGRISLPVAASSLAMNIPSIGVQFIDTSLTQTYRGDSGSVDASTIALRVPGTNGLHAATSSTAPFTWADTDIIYVAGVYQAS